MLMNSHLKVLEPEEQANSIISRWKEIMKVRADTNEMETKRTMSRINKAEMVL
jgi:hypothetical protein